MILENTYEVNALLIRQSGTLTVRFMLVLSASLPVTMQGSSGELVPVFNIICFAWASTFFLVMLLRPMSGSRVQNLRYIVTTYICTTFAFAKYAKQFSSSFFPSFNNVCCIFSCNTAIFILSDQFCRLYNLTVWRQMCCLLEQRSLELFFF